LDRFEPARLVVEADNPNAAKIPNVCEHFGIHWTDIEAFLKQNGWTF
jgi:hypothetical protein